MGKVSKRKSTEKMIPLLKNKWVSRIFNIGYIVGWITSIEFGYKGYYFIGSTVLMLILFWKPLIKIMKAGGDMYANFCKKTADRTVNKLNPWKDSESDRTVTSVSKVKDSLVTDIDSSSCTIKVPKHKNKNQEKNKDTNN